MELLKSGSESIFKVLQSQRSDSDDDVALPQVAAAPSADCANDVLVEPFLDVVVSYDGTWMTRGHKSHICVGFVIHVDTGFVLDHGVLSNYCGTCANKKASLSADFSCLENDPHYCMQNYEGSASSMESQAAARLWSRSQERGYG